MSFAPGTTIVLREVIEGRIRSARPLRVVEDGPERFVGYLVPRSTVAWPRLADNVTQSQTPDQGWRLPLERWRGPGALFVVPAGAGFAAVLFLDPHDATPLGWKVDFFRPLARHDVGFDTLDQAFDLLAAVDCSSWQSKDLDDLAQLVRLGLLAGEERLAFDEDRRRVEGWLDRLAGGAMAEGGEGTGPFGEGWTAWRPEPGWPPLELPTGWDARHDPASPGDAASAGEDPLRPTVTGAGWRSASGICVLDGAGVVHLDLDLDGGALWLGHAPPGVVEAVSRQAPLGWRFGAQHPALDALRRHVEASLPPGWAWCWSQRGHGTDLDEALRTHGWPFALHDACHRAGAELGTFGPGLFAGFAAWLTVGHRDALPPAAPAPDVLSGLAALETLATADPATVHAASERAARLRSRHRLGGSGLRLVGPAGWHAPGVIVPPDGQALVALCVDDTLEAALDARLAGWRAR